MLYVIDHIQSCKLSACLFQQIVWHKLIHVTTKQNFNWMFSLIPFIFDSINDHLQEAQRIEPLGDSKN